MYHDKIKTRDQVAQICADLKFQGKVIGFTSGAFDLLHAGHVDYLEKAKQACDVLVVGINSDASLRSYKGESRPIVPEKQRAAVVAALEAVDYVFTFDERRNKANIEAIRPALYIKAGDYSEDELTSKEIVEQVGGKVLLVPVSVEVSTSEIVGKIAAGSEAVSEKVVEEEGATHIERRPTKSSPAVFLDRDGTINEEVGYLSDPQEFRLLPGALEGIKKFQDMGYRIVVITNQGGVGLGYFPLKDFYWVNSVMLKVFHDAGILIDKTYFCPHSLAEKCNCRKPGTGLLKLARDQLNIDIKRSVFIGDRTVDIETAKRAGCRSVLVKTGLVGQDGHYETTPDFVAKDLAEAAQLILESERESRAEED